MKQNLLTLLSFALLASFGFAVPSAAQTPQESPSRQAEILLEQGRVDEALKILHDLHTASPTDPLICHQLGIAYTRLEKLDKAAEFYQKAVSLKPGFQAARKNLAVVLWFLNKKQESERQFRTFAEAEPDDPVPHLYLGLAEHERKQYEKAKSHFEKAGSFASNNPEVLPTVLESYLATKDFSVPSRLMDQLQAARNPNPDLVFEVGKLFADYQLYEQAAKAFEKIKDLHSDREAVLLHLGMVQLRGGEAEAAAATLAPIADQGTAKTEVYLLLAEAYDQQEMPEKAYEAYRKALDEDPKSVAATIALARFASAHHNNEFALQVLSQGLESVPGSAKLLFEEGLIWAFEGNTGKAESRFVKASEADPQWAAPLLALGVTQLESGQWVQAAATFKKAAPLAPHDFRAEYLYAEALTRTGEAEHHHNIALALQKAVQLAPGDARPRVSLGQAYLSAGRTEEGVKELQSALEIDPENGEALYKLGMAYRSHGKRAESQALLKRFQELKAKSGEEEGGVVQILKLVKDQGP